MMLIFQNMRGNADSGADTDVPAVIARQGQFPRDASNLPAPAAGAIFKLLQISRTALDVLAVIGIVFFICGTALAIPISLFLLLFCKF